MNNSSSTIWRRRSAVIFAVPLAVAFAASLRHHHAVGKTAPLHPKVPTVTHYSVTTLRAFANGHESIALGINDAGQCVGRAGTPDMNYVAVIWVNGVPKRLGALGGTFSEARAINNRGDIVGSAMTVTGVTHAFQWHMGTMRDLGVLPGGIYSFADDINDRGQVVGFGGTATSTHAILWNGGAPKDMGPIAHADESTATSINQAGDIAGGGSLDTDAHEKATLWVKGRQINLGMIPKAHGAIALGLNDHADAVGSSGPTARQQHPILWDHGVLHDMSATSARPFAVATDINNDGVICGYLFGTVETHACTWQGGKQTDLNDVVPKNSGWDLLRATRINVRGQIIGKGRYNGRETGFLLTPVQPNKST